MDRGVKIAIFVASVVSLGLGLIWDHVLSRARDVIAEERSDSMGPERIKARVGPKDLPRQELPPELADANAVVVPPSKLDAGRNQASEPKPGTGTPAASNSLDLIEYEVKSGDSPSRICHTHFKDRGIETKDLYAANPGVNFNPLKVGTKLKIPGKKK